MPSIKTLLDRPAPKRRLGPFLLVEQLGRGGFAPVWLAKEIWGSSELRTAAVKLFALDSSAGGSWGSATTTGRSKIVEEARALSQVEHPNVVRFYSLAIDEKIGVMGLAMELVAGTSIDKRLAARGSLTTLETLAVGMAIASALSAVHRAGLVHRDVKPANVIEAAGVYKLIDFGIAAADEPSVDFDPGEGNDVAPGRSVVEMDDLPLDVVGNKMSSFDELIARGPEGGTRTVSLKIRCGTVGYIDPKCVATGDPATPESDLYALGVMLFECLTGKIPAAAAAPAGKGLRGEVLDGRMAAPKLLTVAPETPSALASLIDSLLLPDPLRRPASAEWVAIRLEQIKSELAGRKRALPPENEGPFRGLGRFKEADRDVYFGRTSEVAAALEVLRSRGLVALLGASGSGKSSLARAGVLPAVAEGALGGWPKRWDTVIVEPGRDPRAAIVAALEPFVPEAGKLAPETLAHELAERAQATEWGLVLLVDQLEEMATLAAGESQAWAAAFLARLGEQVMPGVRTVVAVRRDLLDPLLAFGSLGKALVRGSVLIEPMSELTWGEVLDQALEAYGYKLEDDALRKELLDQLEGTANAMPLVQFALTELWQTRDRSKKQITRASLDGIGGIAGALERHADATLVKIEHRSQGAERVASGLLLSLTTPQGTRATRPVSELEREGGSLGREVIAALDEARIIVREEAGVTLAHEALVTQWGRLRGWVSEAREDRVLAEEIERDAARWRADDTAPLWKKRRLDAAENALRHRMVSVTATADAFIRAGRRAERSARLLAGGLTTTTIVLLTLGVAVYVRDVRAGKAEADHARGQAEQNLAEANKQQEALKAANAVNASLVQRLRDAEDTKALFSVREEARKGKAPAPTSSTGGGKPQPPRPGVSTTTDSSARPRPTPASTTSSRPEDGFF